jgi:hypothetical protein
MWAYQICAYIMPVTVCNVAFDIKGSLIVCLAVCTQPAVLVCKLAHVNKTLQFKSQDLNSEGKPSRDFQTSRLPKIGSRGQGLHH